MINFPNPRQHEFTEWVLFGDYYYNARDIIGFGGDLSIENLRNAYRRGIFPWPVRVVRGDGPGWFSVRVGKISFSRLMMRESNCVGTGGARTPVAYIHPFTAFH